MNPATDPLSGFFWDPLVLEGARELKPLPVPPESPLVPGSLATYDVPVSELSGGGALTIAGQPTVTVHAIHRRIPRPARRASVRRDFQRRSSSSRAAPTRYRVQSGLTIGDVDVTIPTYGNLYRAEAGHTLRLELTNVDSPYITPSRVPSATIVSSVRLDIPTR